MMFITFVLVLLLGVAFVQVSNSYLRYTEQVSLLADLNEEIDSLEDENMTLKQDVEQMDDRSFIEKAARKFHGLIYPDEHIVEFEK